MIVCLICATKFFGLHHRSLTPIQNFSDHTMGLLHPMFQAFHLRGLTTTFLLRPTYNNYISLYVLIRESFIGRQPKYEFTTHSSTLMMDDHTHAHTPNIVLSLCICNANVIVICKTRENSNFWKNGKMVILVKTQNFSRSRMTKRISPLESSCEI